MSETKICETCKYQSELPFAIPCISCEKASKWESRQGGCEFCNGKSGKIEVKHGKAGVSMASTIQNKHLVTVARLSSDEKYLQDFQINFCPMCGKKLVKE